jgi:hypothetical protein
MEKLKIESSLEETITVEATAQEVPSSMVTLVQKSSRERSFLKRTQKILTRLKS